MAQKLTIIGAVLGAFLGFSLLNEGFHNWAAGRYTQQDTLSQNVILLDKNKQPTDVLHPGDVFYASHDVIQRIPCIYHVAYRVAKFYDENADVVDRDPYSYPETINYREAGHYRINEIMKLPNWIPPGDYFLKRAAYYQCDAANSFILQDTKDFKFRIEPN